MNTNPVAEGLNQVLANLHIINIKLHNYHWNIRGLQFSGIHETTEKYYDHFFTLFDDVAERILQIGEKPLTRVKDYLAQADLNEEDRNEFSAGEVLKAVQEDFNHLLLQARRVNQVAADAGDDTTLMLLGDHIAWLEKALWMLRQTLAG